MGDGNGRSGAVVILIIGALIAAFVMNIFVGNNKKNKQTLYYDDPVNLLSQDTRDAIQELNKDLKEKYGGAELFVATVETIGDKSISQYAKIYFNEHSIGSSQNNNGLLLLIAKNENSYYTMYGTGLDDSFDGEIAVVLRRNMEPEFAEDVDAAVYQTVPKLASILKTECAVWYSGREKDPTATPIPTATPKPKPTKTVTPKPEYDPDDDEEFASEFIEKISEKVSRYDAVGMIGTGIGFIIKVFFKLIAGLFSSVLIGFIVVIIIIRAIVKGAKK